MFFLFQDNINLSSLYQHFFQYCQSRNDNVKIISNSITEPEWFEKKWLTANKSETEEQIWTIFESQNSLVQKTLKPKNIFCLFKSKLILFLQVRILITFVSLRIIQLKSKVIRKAKIKCTCFWDKSKWKRLIVTFSLN